MRIAGSLATLCAALALVLLGASNTSASDNALGFSVRVLPDANDRSQGALGRGQDLWFPLEPGESRSREVRVLSAANADQLVQLDVLSLLNIDGKDQVDQLTASPIADWVTFTPREFVLAARDEEIVTMTVTAPIAADGAFRAFMRVMSEGPTPPEVAVSEGIGATVGNAIAIDRKVWVGVGDNAFLTTDFEIADVVGLTIDEQRTLQVEIANIGGTPIAPRGTIELQSLEFTTLQIGPLDFRAREILPGESRFTRVDVPAEVTEGPWKIYVVADQGDIRRTALFEKNLTFPSDPGEVTGRPAWQIVLIALLVIAGLVLLLWGVRTFRKQAGQTAPQRQ